MKAVMIIVWALSIFIVPAGANAADGHDHGKRGANGGELVDAGPYHLELVVKGQELALYVLDAKNKKVAVDGGKATATIMSGSSKATIALSPANPGDNLLKGAGNFEAREDLRVLISVTLAGKPVQQARFTPLHKEGGDAKGHKH